MLKVTKQVECPTCNTRTAQDLKPCAVGAEFVCTVCNNTSHTYTMEHMVNVVRDNVFNITDTPSTRQVPDNLRVYIEHQEGGESEVPHEVIKRHVTATGSLPCVGKTMFGLVNGVPVPYGKVVRVSEED